MKRSSSRGSLSNLLPAENRALAKGLQILELLASSDHPLSLTEVSRAVALGKASALRLLRTLRGTGYVIQEAYEDYDVDWEWPSVRRQMHLRGLRAVAAPHMRELAAQVSETVSLAFLFGDHIRVIDVIESVQHIRMTNFAGRILQPYASSLGKAITAFQPPERIRSLLDVYGVYALTPRTLTSVSAIQEEFELVRKDGFAWDREESVLGGCCAGAPIRVEPEGVMAAISVSMPTARFQEETERALPQLVCQTAAKISTAVTEAAARGEAGKKRPAA